MPMVEGRGVVPPTPVRIRIDDHSLVVLSLEAEKRSRHRGYSRGGTWKKGLIQSSASMPILIGCVGEFAFSEFVNRRIGRPLCEVDLSLNEFGDRGVDFDICGVGHQLKTRRKQSGPSFVRRVSERRRLCPLTIGRYVFAQWNKNLSECLLLGWCGHADVRECKMERSPIASHHNLVVPDNILRPMDRLITAIRADMSMEAMAWH